MKAQLAIALFAAAAVAVPASASTVIFSDNFDSYAASQVPWGGDSVWSTGDSVDLVQSGQFNLTCSGGSGNCVDLSGDRAGSLSHSLFLTPGRYNLSFSYTGNQLDAFGGPWPQVGFTASVGPLNFSSGPLANNSTTFLNYSGDFVVTTAGNYTLNFAQDAGGNNYRGSILDNVQVSAVPEPAAWALMILGFGVIGGAMRRRKAVTALA